MQHKLQNGLNLAVRMRNATLKGRTAGGGHILSMVYCDHVYHMEQ